jgi:hypothetical protein
MRQYFERRFWPVEDAEAARKIRLFMHYFEDRLQLNWDYPFGRGGHSVDLFVRPQPADDVRQLIGKPVPDLEVEEEPGKTVTLRPRGPMLLYVTPAWPRPLVTLRETFADLQAFQQLDASRFRVLGTGATAGELRAWWKERRSAIVPLALTPASASRVGARHLPLAIIVDREGHVTWLKEGYVAGDEAEWRRQLERAGV